MRVLLPLVACITTGAVSSRAASSAANQASRQTTIVSMAGKEVATVAGGCFWCVEAAFSQMKGVDSAISGYLNGHIPNPKYEAVCNGDTGHAEAVQVTYDPSVLSFGKVLDIFFTVHDPTQLNRQGNDFGTQYRSGIYYHNEAQRDAALAHIAELQKSYGSTKIVTEVVPAQTFYPAEDYHQRYFDKNPYQGYCASVVRPKVLKARAKFAELLK